MGRTLRIVAVVPHFAPDVAPTGIIASRIVEELGALGHEIDVVTSLPWYAEHAVAPEWRGRFVDRQWRPWGSVTRVYPFPTADKRNIPKRAAGFAAFCALCAAIAGVGRRADVVFAMTPPLPMAATGWFAALARRAPLVLNVQDVFPDVAVELGILRDPLVIRAASALERWSYARCAAVTVLSEDMRANLAAKMKDPARLHVIPNFVDAAGIVPGEPENSYRAEFGLSGKTVVMYAGNVGMSQSLDLLLDAAFALRDRDDVVFVINGGGSTLGEWQQRAEGLENVRFVPFQPPERLGEVLAAADVHVVPLKRGLARASVPSKTYSILAAARPLVASVDEGSEIARIAAESGAGIAVPPEDPAAFIDAIRSLLDDPERRAVMGQAGRAFIEKAATPAQVAEAYADLFRTLQKHSGRI
ncbi:MAG: glycosyltransferase family 4 protein [Acidothermus sp.]|nr:glycosyltransferase family 4 protein [Acidothermus sp.]